MKTVVAMLPAGAVSLAAAGVHAQAAKIIEPRKQ
jgi:hypothetical protein